MKRAAEAELEASELRRRVGELETQLASSSAELLELRQRAAELPQPSAPPAVPTASGTAQAGAAEAPAELLELRQRLAAQETELLQLRAAAEELHELRREQEDLLVLLTDQEARQEEYKKKLRQLGVQVRLSTAAARGRVIGCRLTCGLKECEDHGCCSQLFT